MKRLFISSFLFFILLLLLAIVLNAPRYAEARAHEAAAEAMQTQAVVTGIAVTGMVLLGLLLTIALIATVAFCLWTFHRRERYLAAHWNQTPQRRLRPRQQPDQPQLPANSYPLSTSNQLPMNQDDATNPLNWQVWETSPWDIDDPF